MLVHIKFEKAIVPQSAREKHQLKSVYVLRDKGVAIASNGKMALIYRLDTPFERDWVLSKQDMEMLRFVTKRQKQQELTENMIFDAIGQQDTEKAATEFMGNVYEKLTAQIPDRQPDIYIDAKQLKDIADAIYGSGVQTVGVWFRGPYDPLIFECESPKILAYLAPLKDVK